MNKLNIDEIITRALKEDIGARDITTELLIPPQKISRGFIICKEEAVICGLEIARLVFQKLDPRVKFHSRFRDSDKVPAWTKVADLEGKTRGLLTAERVALNFLSYLSGIATKTRKFVERTRLYKTKILDTRKTTPTLRALEKFAVKKGGGTNHRFDLSEQVFLKDNHWTALKGAASLAGLVQKIKNSSSKSICIETANLKEFNKALNVKPEIILLDNMDLKSMKAAVKIVRSIKGKKPALEASGGVTLSNVRSIAQTGVNRISVGGLTHSREAVDFSLELDPFDVAQGQS